MQKLTVRLVAALAALTVAFTFVSAVQAGEKNDRFGGDILAVDTTAKTITIRHKTKTGVEDKVFLVDDKTEFGGAGQRATLADMRVGDKVFVKYTEQGTSLLATKVGKSDPHENAQNRKEKKNQ